MIAKPPPACPAPLLVGDIGGTHARFALAEGARLSALQTLKCADYPNLAEAAQAYLAKTLPGTPPCLGAFGIASPVIGDHIDMTNHRWSFSVDETRRQLGFDKLRVVNDLVAIALSVPHLGIEDRRPIGPAAAPQEAPIVVVAPGTGLGVAGLIRHENRWLPVASEAGHATVAAQTRREAEVISVLRRHFGHVSAERIISGPGLLNLYRAICELDGVVPKPDVGPAEIGERARQQSCPRCMEATQLFSAILGTFTANLALGLDARGGAHLAGGVIPKLGVAFDDEMFRQRFEDKGRFSAYLAAIPTALIIHPSPGLLGLAHAF